MGLFSSKPKQVTCPCGASFPKDHDWLTHWDTHLVEVTATNGQPAFAFDCPHCGMSSQAWGADASNERHKRYRAQAAMALHMQDRHNFDL